MGADDVAFLDPRVDAHMRILGRRAQMQQLADRGQKLLGRVFRVDAGFQRMAAERELFLRPREELAGGDAQLPLNQIKPGDHFGDGMLNLETRVHLHEIKGPVRRDDEFHRARADIVDRARRLDRRLAHRRAAFLAKTGRRRLLQHLLVAALHRTVALEQVDALAVGVAKNLDFDMAGTRDIALDQNMGVAEGRRGFALTRGQLRQKILTPLDAAHALAAAARRRLDQDGIADGVGFLQQALRRLVVAVIAGGQGHAGRLHQLFRLRLGAHGADRLQRRADEDKVRFRAGAAKSLVLRQKAVAGMDGLRAGPLGRRDDFFRDEIGVARRRRADADGFVGKPNVAGVGVGF